MKDASKEDKTTAGAQPKACDNVSPPEGETKERRATGELRRIEWLLAKREIRQRHLPQSYGNLVKLNTAKRIAESVGEDVLTDIVDDYLDLLDTSAAIYEKNGDYALGIFSSGWCRMMDEASRKLCDTDDNAEALENKNWRCHQSCWQTSRESIETGKPADIACKGGINIYAVPIVVKGEVIGSINFGYGDPPKDDEKIKELSETYDISVEELKKQSESYESRPQFMIELAKTRLLTSAKLLGSLIERNQAAEAERVSAERYRGIFEFVPVSIWEEDWSAIIEAIDRLRAQGVTDFAEYFDNHPEFVAEALGNVKILDVNPETVTIFEAASKAELLASLKTVFSTPDTLPGLVGELLALASGLRIYKTDMAVRTVRGNLIQILLTMTFPADGTGRVFVSVMDITERKRVEEELRLLNDLVEQAPQPFAMTDPDGKVVRVNRAFKELTGYDDEELRRMTYEDLTPARWHRMESCEVKRMLATQKPARYEKEYRRKDGSIVPIDIAVDAYRDFAGQVKYLYAFILDLTERNRAEAALRESNERFEIVSKATSDVIWDWNLVTNEVWLSEALESHFGYARDNAMLSPDWWVGLIHPDDRAQTETSIRAVIENREHIWASEYRLRRADGSYAHVYDRGYVIYDEAGEPARMTGAMLDITERKQAEKLIHDLNASLERRVASRTAELLASNKEIETANRELEAFSYSVSHDLRAPLRHINSFTEMLVRRESERLDPTSARYLQIVSGAVGRMGRLIDELLAFSRTGRQEIKHARVALNDLVHEAQRELYPEMKDRSIAWSVGLLPEVEGDATLLQSVITNLMANAVKYTRPRADAHIQIGALNGDSENVTIFVKDNGVGFNMEYADKLFGVFQRLHREDEFEGTGIGLATVRRIIHRHGGRVWAESEVGRGTTFYFTLK